MPHVDFFPFEEVSIALVIKNQANEYKGKISNYYKMEFEKCIITSGFCNLVKKTALAISGKYRDGHQTVTWHFTGS